MAKGSDLGSDVDFIKEFEELRLKQKILIESLNRQKKSKEKELIIEINSKLDFLVKVFKDSENSDFDEQTYLDNHFNDLNGKIDQIFEMSSSFDDRLKKMESKMILLSKLNEQEEKKEEEEPPVPEKDSTELYSPSEDFEKKEETEESKSFDTSEIPESSINNKNQSKEEIMKDNIKSETKQNQPSQKEDQKKIESEEGPPPPSFTVDENKVDEVAKNTGKKKGKKWF